MLALCMLALCTVIINDRRYTEKIVRIIRLTDRLVRIID